MNPENLLFRFRTLFFTRRGSIAPLKWIEKVDKIGFSLNISTSHLKYAINGPVNSMTSCKAGGMYGEPLKAVLKTIIQVE